MRIADYFKMYSFQDVFCEFKQLYSVNNDRTLSKGKVHAWEKIYKDIQAAAHKLGNVTTNYHVMVMERWEHVIPELDWNCRVFDVDNEFQIRLLMLWNIRAMKFWRWRWFWLIVWI